MAQPEDNVDRAIRGNILKSPAPAPAVPTSGSFKAQFQASNGKWVAASDGGGGNLVAVAAAADTWETFTLADQSHASLQDGDVVSLQSLNGQFVTAANGGGSTLSVVGPKADAWEMFIIKKVSGSGTIASGDNVFLTTKGTGHFVSNIDNGNQPMAADRTAGSTWETFKIVLP